MLKSKIIVAVLGIYFPFQKSSTTRWRNEDSSMSVFYTLRRLSVRLMDNGKVLVLIQITFSVKILCFNGCHQLPECKVYPKSTMADW